MAGVRIAWRKVRVNVQQLLKGPLCANQGWRPQPKLSRCCLTAVSALPSSQACLHCGRCRATTRCVCLQVVPALDSATAHALGCGWGEQSSKSDLAKLCVVVVRSSASCLCMTTDIFRQTASAQEVGFVCVPSCQA